MSLDSRIRDVVDRAIGGGSVDAATVRVSHGGSLLASYTAGDVSGAAAREDSVWWLASLTKPFVAVALLACVEEGLVDLDQAVSAYLPAFPEFPLVRSAAPGTTIQPSPPFSPEDPNQWVIERGTTPLTVRHLVTGTSGLQTLFIANREVPLVLPGVSLEGFVDAVAEVPLDFEPGARWHYSNATAFEVIERVIEAATGEDIRDVVHARIIDPLGAMSLDYGITDRNRRLALPLPPILAGTPFADGSFPSGSAGMFGSADDVERLGRALLEGGRTNGERILSEASVAAVTSNQIGALRLGGLGPELYGGLPERTDPRLAFGYGVITVLDTTDEGIPAGSFGWDGMGMRRLWAIPSLDTTVVMLVEGAGAAAVHREIERAVVES